MVEIKELKPGQWLVLEDAQKIFPKLNKRAIYNWRASMKSGRVPSGHYPRTLCMGQDVYIHHEDFLQYVNRELLKNAS